MEADIKSDTGGDLAKVLFCQVERQLHFCV